MSAARIITTTEKFDEMGKLIERITREEMCKNETEIVRDAAMKSEEIAKESECGSSRNWKAQSSWATEPLRLQQEFGALPSAENRATEIKISWLNG